MKFRKNRYAMLKLNRLEKKLKNGYIKYKIKNKKRMKKQKKNI